MFLEFLTFQTEEVLAEIFIHSFFNIYVKSNSILNIISIHYQYNTLLYTLKEILLLGFEPCMIMIPLMWALMFLEPNLLPKHHTLGQPAISCNVPCFANIVNETHFKIKILIAYPLLTSKQALHNFTFLCFIEFDQIH